MIVSLRTQLHDLALLWCRLTDRSLEDFEREFYSQLAALNRFTGLFPGKSPTVLIACLNMCVMESFQGRFSAHEIRQARMLLSQEQPDGVDARA